MIIKKCYISSFGVLKDKTFEFTDGLNTIKQDNGFGKTTLTVFIKSMFYGLNSNKKDLDLNERKRYCPWGENGLFGGYIDFLYKDKDYRIERFFGKKESEDTVKLIDLSTMVEYKNNQCLGERLFGIDEKGFVATCFVSQNEFDDNGKESIISKFNDIQKTNSSNTYLDAYNLLDKKAKSYKADRGDSGSLNSTLREIATLNQNIERVKNSENVYENLKNSIKNNEEKVIGLKREIDGLTEKVKKASQNEIAKIKKENYDKILTEISDCDKKIGELNGKINFKPISENEYNDYTSAFNDFSALLKQRELIDNGKEKLSGKSNVLIFSVFACVLLALGIVFIFFNKIFSVVCFALTICFFGLTLFARIKKPKGTDKTVDTDSLQIVKKHILEFLYRYGYSEGDLQSFIIIINGIRDKSKDILALKDKKNKLEEQKIDIEKEKEKIESYDDSLESLTVLTENLEIKQKELKTVNELINRDKYSLSNYEDSFAMLKDWDSRKDELSIKYKEDVEKYNIIVKTLEYLELANENIKSKYRQPLEESFNKFLQKISKNNTFTAKIDIDLNVFVEEKGTLKETSYYSMGLQNIFELCKRFALCEVLFTNEKPFMVFDDVFVNLDDKNLTDALATLKELSGNNQILYFVCHDSRRI